MTLTEGTATRQNSEGHPCPPWCAVDHDVPLRGHALSYHGTEPPMIHTPSGYLHATAYQDGFSDATPQIALTCMGRGGALLLDARHSDKLAAFVEQLADATPDQHRELAAAIRQAAADITEAGNG